MLLCVFVCTRDSSTNCKTGFSKSLPQSLLFLPFQHTEYLHFLPFKVPTNCAPPRPRVDLLLSLLFLRSIDKLLSPDGHTLSSLLSADKRTDAKLRAGHAVTLLFGDPCFSSLSNMPDDQMIRTPISKAGRRVVVVTLSC